MEMRLCMHCHFATQRRLLCGWPTAWHFSGKKTGPPADHSQDREPIYIISADSIENISVDRTVPSNFQIFRFKDRMGHAVMQTVYEDSDDSIHPPAHLRKSALRYRHGPIKGSLAFVTHHNQTVLGYKVNRPKGGVQTLTFCVELRSSKLDSKLMDQDLNLFQSVCAASLSKVAPDISIHT